MSCKISLREVRRNSRQGTGGIVCWLLMADSQAHVHLASLYRQDKIYPGNGPMHTVHQLTAKTIPHRQAYNQRDKDNYPTEAF